MRHDAAKCREDAKSRLIRISLGLYTPAERQAYAEAEARRAQAAQKKSVQGQPLGLEEEP